MTDVHPEFGRLMTAEEYAREWEDNSSHFERHGYYRLPLERLGKPKTVLEIGCGSGRSTLALARKGHTVIAVEINEPAARSACEYLGGQGIRAQLANGFPQSMDDAADGPQVVVVVADVFAENGWAAIQNLHPGAVLCWFIGAQLDVIAANAGKPVIELTREDVRVYRLSLQAKCYEIGRHVLPRGGIVQVADRMRLASWQDKDTARADLLHTQSHIAGPGFELTKASVFLARVSGVFEGSSIQYLTQRPDAQVRVVTSVTASLK